MGIDRGMEMADDEKLWDVRKGLPKSEEEQLFWQYHGKNYDKVKDLLKRLQRIGHEAAEELAEIVGMIDECVKNQTYVAATMHIDRALEFADDNKLWDESAKELWDGLQKDVESIRKLYGALYEAGHASAKQLGDLIDAMDDARRSEDWDDAVDQITAALTLADEQKLWDAVKTDDSGINPATAKISGSVGKGGKNKAADVETVQRLLNHNGASPALDPDGDCGKLTIGAIEAFQKSKLGWKDGRVDPGGKTWAALTGGDVIKKVVEVAEDVADKVVDTADKVVDKVKDIAEDIGDFLEDFFDGDDDKKKRG